MGTPGVSNIIKQPSNNNDEFLQLTEKEEPRVNSILKANVGGYGDLVHEQEHVCKNLHKTLKAAKYIVEQHESMKQVSNIRSAGS